LNHYELALLLRPDLAEKDVLKTTQEMKDLLTRLGASAIVSDRTERRALAYPVRKQTEATYIYIVCTGPADIPARVREELKHREEILRMGFTRLPQLPAPSPEPASTPAPEATNG
jgi:ribosomal protein S6